MPAPADVDWQAVRETWTLTGSYAKAAEFHGTTRHAVKQRAWREGWKAVRQAAEERVTKAGLTVTASKAVLPTVTSKVQFIEDELSARGSNSRLNAARIGDATLAAIASEPAERQIPLLGSANEAASLLVKGNVPGWERQQEQQAQQVVNIALLGAELPTINVEPVVGLADASDSVLDAPQS